MGSSERAKIPSFRILGLNNNLLSHSVVRTQAKQFLFLAVEAVAIHFLALSLFLYHFLEFRKGAAITAAC